MVHVIEYTMDIPGVLCGGLTQHHVVGNISLLTCTFTILHLAKRDVCIPQLHHPLTGMYTPINY